MATLPKITDAAANKLKHAEPGQQIDYFDQQYPGLVLRVGARRKAWYIFRRVDGRIKRKQIGLFPAELSVAQAHDAWRAMNSGAVTLPTSQVSVSALTCRAAFEEWMKRDQAKNRSCDQVRRRMENDFLPRLGDRDFASITRSDINEVIDAITDRGKLVLANRLRSYIQRMFRWSVRAGKLDRNPIEVACDRNKEKRRERVLTDDELSRVWAAADRLGYPYGHAVKLLILTGCRKSEIDRLRWSEISEDAIELSGERTKNGEAHIVPLTDQAKAIIKSITPTGDKLFPGSMGQWGRISKRLDAESGVTDWTIHDLRRTVATGLQRLGTPIPVTEAILNHKAARAGIVGVYQVYDYADEKRAALVKWSDKVAALVS